MALLGANGSPIGASTPGIYQSFDGGLPDGWIDAADTYPSSFDPITSSGDGLLLQPSTVATTNAAPGYDTLVGHHMAMVDVGVSTDFTVGIRWEPNGWSYFSQAAPLVLADMDASNVEQMGCITVWDVGIPNGAAYMHNAFRTPTIAETFDISYYTQIGGGAQSWAPFKPPLTPSWIEMSVTGGNLSYRWNGRYLDGIYAVPAWATGRTYVGIHVVSIDYPIGNPEGPLGGNNPTAGPTKVTGWWFNPL